MNEPMSQSKKQSKVAEGIRIFKAIEDGFDNLAKLWQEGCDGGMIDTNECHQMQNDTMALKCMTLSLHCRATAIAKRHKCDLPGGGSDGGAVIQGGPGR